MSDFKRGDWVRFGGFHTITGFFHSGGTGRVVGYLFDGSSQLVVQLDQPALWESNRTIGASTHTFSESELSPTGEPSAFIVRCDKLYGMFRRAMLDNPGKDGFRHSASAMHLARGLAAGLRSAALADVMKFSRDEVLQFEGAGPTNILILDYVLREHDLWYREDD